jgi:hypothetical protein
MCVGFLNVSREGWKPDQALSHFTASCIITTRIVSEAFKYSASLKSKGLSSLDAMYIHVVVVEYATFHRLISSFPFRAKEAGLQLLPTALFVSISHTHQPAYHQIETLYQ